MDSDKYLGLSLAFYIFGIIQIALLVSACLKEPGYCPTKKGRPDLLKLLSKHRKDFSQICSDCHVKMSIIVFRKTFSFYFLTLIFFRLFDHWDPSTAIFVVTVSQSMTTTVLGLITVLELKISLFFSFSWLHYGFSSCFYYFWTYILSPLILSCSLQMILILNLRWVSFRLSVASII